jgi:hypothetical protein
MKISVTVPLHNESAENDKAVGGGSSGRVPHAVLAPERLWRPA